jgi:hypothetical protein
MNCEDCNGTGRDICPGCSGTGREYGRGICIDCAGRGFFACFLCRGTGTGLTKKTADPYKGDANANANDDAKEEKPNAC